MMLLTWAAYTMNYLLSPASFFPLSDIVQIASGFQRLKKAEERWLGLEAMALQMEYSIYFSMRYYIDWERAHGI